MLSPQIPSEIAEHLPLPPYATNRRDVCFAQRSYAALMREAIDAS